MTSPTLPRTAEELLEYSAPNKRVELVRGVLVVREPPGYRHGIVIGNLHFALRSFLVAEQARLALAQPMGHLTVGDTGFTLQRKPDTVRGPDLAYVSRERHDGPAIDGYLELAPDIAIEVRSPGDRTGAVMEKITDFLNAGARLVWVVDPRRQQVIAYADDGAVTVFANDDALDGGEVLPGFRCPLSEIFAGA